MISSWLRTAVATPASFGEFGEPLQDRFALVNHPSCIRMRRRCSRRSSLEAAAAALHSLFNCSSGGRRRRIGQTGIGNSRRPATDNIHAAARLAPRWPRRSLHRQLRRQPHRLVGPSARRLVCRRRRRRRLPPGPAEEEADLEVQVHIRRPAAAPRLVRSMDLHIRCLKRRRAAHLSDDRRNTNSRCLYLITKAKIICPHRRWLRRLRTLPNRYR